MSRGGLAGPPDRHHHPPANQPASHPGRPTWLRGTRTSRVRSVAMSETRRACAQGRGSRNGRVVRRGPPPERVRRPPPRGGRGPTKPGDGLRGRATEADGASRSRRREGKGTDEGGAGRGPALGSVGPRAKDGPCQVRRNRPPGEPGAGAGDRRGPSDGMPRKPVGRCAKLLRSLGFPGTGRGPLGSRWGGGGGGGGIGSEARQASPLPL